ncbi:MAG: prepilin peptidase [Nitrospinaceae bacterium]|nr:preprotein translocase subunit SecA [Nitrospinaceae bacterium]NIR56558.1 preprotein translocase subunit SecA [Nitrospinaceae bacterium]NIS87017.1 preprotein translocase subunit SecA [Nitrospinaceae bacterium]NIT83859.1 preprotein translocase subunit SecA [Nitrospinaceae bacterium]NIU46067.1 preprotein translocase subunit SecA [Nitrospinaceae bacterium]
MDWAAERLAKALQKSTTQSVSQGKAFVKSVNRAGARFNRLSNAQLKRSIPSVRRILRKDGFKPAGVAVSFALIREVAHRSLGMRPFDVQLLGGWAMMQGMIAEMETGEGKTLTATLPACTAALAGIPVHIITVNDYLVKRDAEWMGPVYRGLGLTVGTIVEGMDFKIRRQNYSCDITYGTNKQIVFDYLKDRLALKNKRGEIQMHLNRLNENAADKNKLLLRGLCFGIVDEADSVLIDEARTPLIISNNMNTSSPEKVYKQALEVARDLVEGEDYHVGHRERKVELTPEGRLRMMALTQDFGGMWKGQIRAQELTLQALQALHLYIKDKHYLIDHEKIKIIDEFTGRVMSDRSWERGLHQMIEVKEDCPLSGMRETLARISYQQFFRRYLKLSGMTGTAHEVSPELHLIYNMKVAKIPSNRPSRRMSCPTRVFHESEEKWRAIIGRVEEIHKTGRPVLIGTRSVAVSELLSSMLNEKRLQHRILNARQDKDEAEIVKVAGRPGKITVATNMAGRGTDIKLSSHISRLGGLHVIVSEPHEARRIDRQLIGRCGRQGDPGSYEIFFAYDDEIIINFAPGWMNLFFKPIEGLGRPRGSVFDRLILYVSQQSAEKYFSKIRFQLLKMDKQLDRVLAFSGQSE